MVHEDRPSTAQSKAKKNGEWIRKRGAKGGKEAQRGCLTCISEVKACLWHLIKYRPFAGLSADGIVIVFFLLTIT